ncbi:MAG: hypothetical protein HXY21_03680 [Parvularculaceae bacterium]|nr:hypothetical protein [Parvularculaceae bacterium]
MKFPVLKAVSATIAYLAQHAIDLAKALWLPTLLLVALQFYAMSPLFDAFAALLKLGPNPEPAAAAGVLADIGKWTLVLMAGSAIAVPMAAAASLRHVVRGDRLSLPFYLQYGGDELRILAAQILLSLMILLIMLVGGLAAAVVAFIAAIIARPAAPTAGSLADFAINLVVMWFRLRLCVLFPASMATRTIGFGVAWTATRNQVLRLLGFWILVGVPIAVIFGLAIGPFIGGFLPHLEALSAAGEDQAAVAAAMAPVIEEFSALFSPEGPSFPAFAAALYLATLATTAIANVAAGVAWRRLTDKPAPIEADVGMRLAA